ncbi:MAG TPA: Rrf2 family transcriptional regulator, partial [Verrucomicrobiales bacterium]|nr:Rrf2 family transcriptional regulator [Verrucomicrobiales bacterium]
MKLSQRGEYGLRALMFLGMDHGPEVVRIKDIAE